MTKIAQCGKIYLSSNDPPTKENPTMALERIRTLETKYSNYT